MRVVDENNQGLGIMETKAALEAAHAKGLDLVEIAPNANPPVARIIDLGKYLYQQEKKAREQKTKQKATELKLVKITPSISEHDALIKIKKLEEFIKEGHQVEINMFLRGRERANAAFARGKFENFLKLIQIPFKIDRPIKQMPSGFSVIISKT